MALGIRDFLKEATENINLPKEPTAASESGGEPMSAADFAPPALPGAQAGAAPLTGPSIPTGDSGSNTLQKEIVNKESILAILGPLKIITGNLEKDFRTEDFTVDTAKIHISSFFKLLKGMTEALAAVVGIEENIEDAATAVEGGEAPIPETPTEGGVEPPMEGEQEPYAGGPEEAGFTDPWGHSPETGQTNPEDIFAKENQPQQSDPGAF